MDSVNAFAGAPVRFMETPMLWIPRGIYTIGNAWCRNLHRGVPIPRYPHPWSGFPWSIAADTYSIEVAINRI